MSETEAAEAGSGRQSVLARKLAATKEGAGGLTSSLTLKALRRSVARAAADLCNLPMAVLAARQSNRMSEDLADQLSDKDLLVVLDCPQGRLGAASMDAATVTALIQQQTIGAVIGKAPSERHYTPTDAAMTADFLERSFAKVVAMLDGQTDQSLFSGYRFGAQVENVRSLVLGMEADDYRVIELNLDLACGAMQGVMKLILPEPTAEELQDGQGSANGPSLGASLDSIRAELTAVLCKMRVPVQQFASLKIGDSIPLDSAFLYETDLLTIGGKPVAQGRLGQMNGSRAVRLNPPRNSQPRNGGAEAAAFSEGGGMETMPEPAPALEMDMGIAAQGLQDPMDDMGLPALDAGPGLEGSALDAGAGDGLDAGFGGGLGGDLGSGLDGGADPMGMPMLEGEGAMSMDGLDGGLTDLPDLPELPDFPAGDLGDFAAGDMDEISQLAGFDGALPES
ncbi:MULTISPECIES: FliM/FliN family flagellar motor C-terminal domain-containing protein [unclassified Leisingera]|uniref:FliM/FliN family flagellar motor C-terminal domain-containing protein n=2 Tax=Leisingera TaxID=191028 RepID=UPI0002D2CC90|nr:MULTISPECIES: FliM/FliN family flagellar motor C-terminal domain-containing protein [unclassified Leisingera]KIC25517.1 surface presentation of antigens (SPOA) protein [Leisingera sp. ANG-S3]KIC54379.1 surface presentation of antigens (SPOA) protein [Leisingera sp. ANG-S]KID10800.1 surface presentation of antigens (SPOA) protein [Leisingera sp. ANG1]